MTPRERILAKISEVAARYGFDAAIVLGKNKTPEVVKARASCIHALRAEGLSHRRIGLVMGRGTQSIKYHLNSEFAARKRSATMASYRKRQAAKSAGQ